VFPLCQKRSRGFTQRPYFHPCRLSLSGEGGVESLAIARPDQMIHENVAKPRVRLGKPVALKQLDDLLPLWQLAIKLRKRHQWAALFPQRRYQFRRAGSGGDLPSQAMNIFYTSDTSDDSAFTRMLEESALKVHNELAIRSTENPSLSGMATTLTLWLGVWPRAYLLQVGDSRCYALRDGQLIQLSRDQTMAEDFVDQGVFSRGDPAHARLSHILSSAIGGPEAAPVVRRLEQNWATIGLLCSDGLTRHVTDERIRERLMTMTSARQACEALLQDALDGGGEDNITVVVGRTIPLSVS